MAISIKYVENEKELDEDIGFQPMEDHSCTIQG